jgi:hypothetical protein
LASPLLTAADRNSVINDVGSDPTFVEVPPIRSYVSVERAQRKLAQAGLVGVAPTVQFPHYFVMTKPKAGTKVELGSEVRLIIGDG